MSSDYYRKQFRNRDEKKHLSPLLDQIIYGKSNVSLNLIERTKELGGQGLFNSRLMNNTVLFKYPNFDKDPMAEATEEETDIVFDDTITEDFFRPVETAIYIPYTVDDLSGGGYGIYMRQKGYEELMGKFLGLNLEDASPTVQADIKLLELIDDVPSLDPFLLKTQLESNDVHVPEGYFTLDPKEEERIKGRISDQIEPFISKAFGIRDRSQVAAKTQWFIDAIWDPKSEAAHLFIKSFRIENRDVPRIFMSWKGMIYYQWIFQRSQRQIADVLQWFQSKDAIPHDLAINKPMWPQLKMHKETVVSKIQTMTRNVHKIFKEYDHCRTRFIGHNDPMPLRKFLMDVNQQYWVLGFCCTALDHVSNIFLRVITQTRDGHCSFAQLTQMCDQIEATVNAHSQMGTEIG